jgi:DNA-binding beta-propeller fold protein YncE
LGYTGDGGPATAARVSDPYGIKVDSAGNLYIADLNNSVVRKIDSITSTISTFAGTGAPGYSGDGGPATSARLHTLYGIAVDSAGNLYIADRNNFRIRKVTLGTNVSTVYTPPWFTPLNYSVPCKCNTPVFT